MIKRREWYANQHRDAAPKVPVPMIRYDTMRRDSELALVRIKNFDLFLAVVAKMSEAFPVSRITASENRREHTILLNSQEELLYFKMIIGYLQQQKDYR